MAIVTLFFNPVNLLPKISCACQVFSPDSSAKIGIERGFPYMAQVFLTCAHAHTKKGTIPTTSFGSNTTSQLK